MIVRGQILLIEKIPSSRRSEMLSHFVDLHTDSPIMMPTGLRSEGNLESNLCVVYSAGLACSTRPANANQRNVNWWAFPPLRRIRWIRIRVHKRSAIGRIVSVYTQITNSRIRCLAALVEPSSDEICKCEPTRCNCIRLGQLGRIKESFASRNRQFFTGPRIFQDEDRERERSGQICIVD